MLLAAVLAAGGLLYVLVLRSGDDGVVDKTPVSESSKGPKTGNKAPDRRVTEVPPRAAPTLEKNGTATEPGVQFEAVGDNGTRVRDYRGTGAPIRNPDAPIKPPFRSKRIDAKVVATMGQAMKRAAKKCQSEHTAEVSEGAKVQPRATYTIKEERLVVTDVDITLVNIEENGGFRSCLQSAALSVTVDAPGHRDVEKDTMAVLIRL